MEQDLTQLINAYVEIASWVKVADVTIETLIKQVGSFKAEMAYHFDRLSIHMDAQDAHLMDLHEKADQADKTLSELKQGQAEMQITLSQILARLPEKTS